MWIEAFSPTIWIPNYFVFYNSEYVDKVFSFYCYLTKVWVTIDHIRTEEYFIWSNGVLLYPFWTVFPTFLFNSFYVFHIKYLKWKEKTYSLTFKYFANSSKLCGIRNFYQKKKTQHKEKWTRKINIKSKYLGLFIIRQLLS